MPEIVKTKRTRRFFTETFKRELVWKVKMKVSSIDELSRIHKIDKQLIHGWVIKFNKIAQGTQSMLPHSEFDQQINAMLERILIQRLENLMAITPVASTPTANNHTA